MSELDLDALEREVVESPEKWPVAALRLIQRLREAEFQVEGIRTAMHNAQTRIAQLERVRVAATAVANAIEAKPPRYFGGTVTRLRKALAAAEEST